jgi:hypothetical protein
MKDEHMMPVCREKTNKQQTKISIRRSNHFRNKKLPPNTQAGFDLTTHMYVAPQAETTGFPDGLFSNQKFQFG